MWFLLYERLKYKEQNKREMIGNRTVDLWGREWGFAMPGRGKDEERKGKN